ncbi:ergothioneine biosynthesis protein EgtC [Nocardiopsis sp. RSe5-2]|uniref:Ergothioneine biosynthesis protein EgtC n=1 Tax=Nocardiopsis endophytica TaxID=3018445 RepID=A0ABT4UCN4_9ACTN|nr:ergothioneine biosynthesis protein EgtC [Nocardiopsis endophytica]MDA2814506.1 ergothioneine biosynthesis protein EgtC [Nocardiopsis endophytica]
MCRHLAYLGPPASLHRLLYGDGGEGANPLYRQSYAPREQRHGTVNADGFGAGWYPPGGGEPLRYRRAMPIWADTSFEDAARAITTGCLVAAVRDATPGFGTDESCAQPFRADGILFSHNGAADDDESLAAALGAPVPAGALDARTPVDSAPLFANVVRLRRRGAGLGEALAATVAAALEYSPGRYNLLASDGHTIAATAFGDTLYTRAPDGGGGGGTVIASEPLDDAAEWHRVPECSLVIADSEGIRTTAVAAPAARGRREEGDAQWSAPTAT